MSTRRPGPGGRSPGWQQEHMRRYVASGGQDGHIWEGVTTLLLTTTGRLRTNAYEGERVLGA